MRQPSFAHLRRLLGSPRIALAVWGVTALATTALLTALPAGAQAASGRRALGHHADRVVRYHGYRIAVPAGWPVLRLNADRTACVRFDHHAVYLGVPGADQRCPATAAGRTEAILVSPLGAGTAAMLPAAVSSRAGAGGEAQLVIGADRVLVTSTWGRHPAVIRRALGVHSLAAAVAASRARRPSEVAFARTR
ncbi:MAG: hypothetical protein ACRDMJ_14080, partial [Solirubrobacteraceae bacterium]